MTINGEEIGLLGLVLALIGVVWRMLTARIKVIEDLIGGKGTLFYGTESRLTDFEKRLDKLEDKLHAWMTRIEDKIDGFRETK